MKSGDGQASERRRLAEAGSAGKRRNRRTADVKTPGVETPSDTTRPAVAPEGASPGPTVAKQYRASLYSDRVIEPELAEAISRLEKALKMTVWVFAHNASTSGRFRFLDDDLWLETLRDMAALEPGKPIGLLVDSLGGYAGSAYRIAKLFRAHCGGFTAIVPRIAKSAATLMCLGADRILLGLHGELGPLDVQVMDPEREDWISGLDQTQALNRLMAFALESLDRSMIHVGGRTRKSVATLLPHMLHFVIESIRPLVEKMDAVSYTKMSRLLKVAEEYAVRLLRGRTLKKPPEEIANGLVEAYPDHTFIIDEEEARTLGLQVETPSADLRRIIDSLAFPLKDRTILGRILVEEHAQ